MSRILRTTRFWLLGTVATAALAGTAYATIPAGDGAIHGCYAKSGGTLRVVDASVTNCTAGETALDWSQQGQPGPKGDPGAPGPAGPQGTQGEPGTPGAVAGRERVFAQSGVPSSSDHQEASVNCPAGKVPVGGGANIARERGGNAGLKVVLSASQTIGDGWFATAEESAPIDEPWVLHVSVICVDAA
jgi:hypothetical protein